MKRLKQLLATGMLCSMLTVTTGASQGLMVSEDVVQDSIRQMEIMAGDFDGNLLLEREVSRAEFAAMLVAASTYKNVTTHFGYTLFPDVLSSYWASGYIKVVVEQGYMVGYLDGTFGPKNPVLLEEAVTAVLNLLGYNANTLQGTYPQAQLAKSFELDLDEYMTAKQGEPMTREQCMYLFFNLMNTDTLSGSPYATQMGYPLDSSGNLDTIALTNNNTDGPYLFGSSTLPTSLDNVSRLYRNNKEASVKDIEKYDVCYYNETLSTVWVYSDKITGRLTDISSVNTPQTITVAGTTYSLETTEVKYKFSTGGSFREGDMITLLLGKDGQVADAIAASSTDSTLVGVVLGRGIGQYTEDDLVSTSNYIKMITTNGELHEFDSGNKYYEAGRVIQVSYAGGAVTSQGISTKSIEGKVNNQGTAIGSHKLAEDVEIFEMSEGSNTYQQVYLSRLIGYYIEAEDVRYYTTNSKGEIDSIILEDTTGDLGHFALLTKVNEVSAGMTLMGQYTYLSGGQGGFYMTETQVFDLSKGGALFTYDDGEVDKITKLPSKTVSYINALSANLNGKNYTLADGLEVYEIYNNSYQLVKLEDVSDLDRYKLTAYYDENTFSAGEQVRIILAEAIK